MFSYFLQVESSRLFDRYSASCFVISYLAWRMHELAGDACLSLRVLQYNLKRVCETMKTYNVKNVNSLDLCNN